MLKKRQWVVPTLAVAAIGGSVLATQSTDSARGAQSASAPTDIMNYTPPVGPELSPTAAVQNEIRFARMAGQFGAVSVTVGRGTFAQASAVSEFKSPSAAVVSGPTEVQEEEESPAYLLVFQTATAGGEFAPNVPTPHGESDPTGTVMALVVNAITGFVEERYVGDRAPEVSELGATSTVIVPAETVSAFDASAKALELAEERERNAQTENGVRLQRGYSPPATRNIRGTLYLKGRPAVGWRIVIARSVAGLERHAIQTLHTKKGGHFATTLEAGKFVLAAESGDEKLCGIKTVEMPAKLVTQHVTLRCS